VALDLDRLIAEQARTRHGLVTRRLLRDQGVRDWAIDHRLERGLLIPIEPGVFRVAGVPATPLQETLGAVLGVGAPAAASHQTAVWLWGIWNRQPTPTHVTARAGDWRPKSYVVHRSSDFYDVHTSEVEGVPVTTMARTIVDLGATARLGTVAHVLDAALRARLVTLDGVREVIDDVARPGRSGVRAARLLVEERDRWVTASESELEDLFVRIVRNAALPLPSPQVEIRGRWNEFVARVDFFYPRSRVAVELDGFSFHTDPATFSQDRARQNRLVMEGIVLLRYTARDLRERPEGVAAELAQALRARSA